MKAIFFKIVTLIAIFFALGFFISCKKKNVQPSLETILFPGKKIIKSTYPEIASLNAKANTAKKNNLLFKDQEVGLVDAVAYNQSYEPLTDRMAVMFGSLKKYLFIERDFISVSKDTDGPGVISWDIRPNGKGGWEMYGGASIFYPEPGLWVKTAKANVIGFPVWPAAGTATVENVKVFYFYSKGDTVWIVEVEGVGNKTFFLKKDGKMPSTVYVGAEEKP